MQKNRLKTNRTYSLKKADVDGVSTSAFGLSKGDYLGIFNWGSCPYDGCLGP